VTAPEPPTALVPESDHSLDADASTIRSPATRPLATHPATTTDTVPTGALGNYAMLLPGRPNLLLAQRTVVSRR
jgi:hypothetical protein